MTRETRIGLVVGLLFIVAFGLVLSELTGTTSDPVGSQFASNADTSDNSPVPVSDDHPLSVVRRQLAAEGPAASESLETSGSHGGSEPREETVVVATERATPTESTQTNHANSGRVRTYTVRGGDTLIGIAQRFYGSGSHWRRIMEANSDRIDDPASITVGMELHIPAPPQSSESGVREMNLDELRRHFGASEPAETTNRTPRTHTVRLGDNLTKIARQFYGDADRDAVMKIYNANRAVLSTPDVLPVGAELKIPR